jgi:polyphosphate kinase
MSLVSPVTVSVTIFATSHKTIILVHLQHFPMAEEKKIVFLNRDLSWLSFNHRVLQEAADRSVPLYSRIAFLAIFSSNLDEFFRVRMPSIFAFTSIEAKKTTLRDEYPKELVQIVQRMVLEQQEEFGSILREQILPELQQNHICLYYNQPIRAEHTETILEYFLSKQPISRASISMPC